VTAFYMTRLMLMTFLGAKRWRPGVHPHESPLVMTVPLIVLGAASVLGGLLLNNWIEGWLDPAVGGAHAAGEQPGLLHFSLVGVVTLLVVAGGVALSVVLFGPRRSIPEEQPASRSPLTIAGRRDLYGDAVNEAVFMRPGQRFTEGLARVDRCRAAGPVQPAPPRPERLRPLLRPDHDGRSGRGGRCPRARPAGLRGRSP
jgi:NADH-quinone oxidoreductase subunit L